MSPRSVLDGLGLCRRLRAVDCITGPAATDKLEVELRPLSEAMAAIQTKVSGFKLQFEWLVKGSLLPHEWMCLKIYGMLQFCIRSEAS